MRGQTEELAETASSLGLAIVGQADHPHQQRLTNGHSQGQSDCAAAHLEDEKPCLDRRGARPAAVSVAIETAGPLNGHKKAPSLEGAAG
jgi:hypothetical protein